MFFPKETTRSPPLPGAASRQSSAESEKFRGGELASGKSSSDGETDEETPCLSAAAGNMVLVENPRWNL